MSSSQLTDLTIQLSLLCDNEGEVWSLEAMMQFQTIYFMVLGTPEEEKSKVAEQQKKREGSILLALPTWHSDQTHPNQLFKITPDNLYKRTWRQLCSNFGAALKKFWGKLKITLG